MQQMVAHHRRRFALGPTGNHKWHPPPYTTVCRSDWSQWKLLRRAGVGTDTVNSWPSWVTGKRQMAQLDKKAFISFSQLTCDLKLSLLRCVFTQNFHRDVRSDFTRNDPQLEIIRMLFSREEKDWDTCPAHRMLVTNQKETVRTVTRWTSLEEHILKTAVGLGQSCVHHDWLCTILLEQNNKISHFSGLRMEGVV